MSTEINVIRFALKIEKIIEKKIGEMIFENIEDATIFKSKVITLLSKLHIPETPLDDQDFNGIGNYQNELNVSDRKRIETELEIIKVIDGLTHLVPIFGPMDINVVIKTETYKLLREYLCFLGGGITPYGDYLIYKNIRIFPSADVKSIEIYIK